MAQLGQNNPKTPTKTASEGISEAKEAILQPLAKEHLAQVRCYLPVTGTGRRKGHLSGLSGHGEVFLTSGRAGFARDFWGDLGVRRHLGEGAQLKSLSGQFLNSPRLDGRAPHSGRRDCPARRHWAIASKAAEIAQVYESKLHKQRLG